MADAPTLFSSPPCELSHLTVTDGRYVGRYIYISVREVSTTLNVLCCYRQKRVIGAGVMGRFFRPSIHVQAFTRDVKVQLDNMDDYR